jgi:hypothetical protein
MTDWIEHTTDTCPVDPETVVEVRHGKHHRVSSGKALYMPWGRYSDRLPGGGFGTPALEITHYRIITPAKPPEPEMARRYDDAEAYAESQVRPEMNADAAAALKRRIADAYRAGEAATPITSHQPMDGHNLITLRLECLKLAVNDHFYEAGEPDYEKVADRFLHYVLNGSVDKA